MYILTRLFYLGEERKGFTLDKLDIDAFINDNLTNEARKKLYLACRLDLYNTETATTIKDITLKEFFTYKDVLYCGMTDFGYRFIVLTTYDWDFLDIVEEPTILPKYKLTRVTDCFKPVDDKFILWTSIGMSYKTIFELYIIKLRDNINLSHFILGLGDEEKYLFKVTPEIRRFVTKYLTLKR